MPATKSETAEGLAVVTDEWTIVWNNQTIDLTSKQALKHRCSVGIAHLHGRGTGDGLPYSDLFVVLTDGTLIVADAPASNQPLNDVHVFTDDAQHFALGASAPFDDVIGTVFVQQDDGSFYAVVSRTLAPLTRTPFTSSTETNSGKRGAGSAGPAPLRDTWLEARYPWGRFRADPGGPPGVVALTIT